MPPIGLICATVPPGLVIKVVEEDIEIHPAQELVERRHDGDRIPQADRHQLDLDQRRLRVGRNNSMMSSVACRSAGFVARITTTPSEGIGSI